MKKFLVAVVVIFLIIQFIPYGKEHANPKVIAEPHWDSPQTRALFMRACGDCHSHETKWPWYSKIAPFSWIIYRHVQEGREHFNVSAWGYQKENEGDEAAKTIKEGEMPPLSYLLFHPEARLSEDEKQQLIKGLERTFGVEEEDED